MVIIKFYKVLELPATLEANALYFVDNDAYAEAYLTSASGEPKLLGNSEMIGELTSYINGGSF